MKKLEFILLESLTMMIFLSGCALSAAKPASLPVSMTRDDLLGTVSTISVYEDFPKALLESAFDRIREIHNRMTTGADSEIASLNSESGKEAVRLSEDTFSLLSISADISEKSGGAFDITVGPLATLWNIGGENARIPAEQELSTALGLVGWRLPELNEAEKTARLPLSGMAVDLGGIAKGYACDEAARILREAGVEHALLDLGGNIYGLGTKPDGSAWRIGIRSPVIGEDGIVGALSAANKIVVTSGVYERYFERDGTIYHHILDPHTGYPASNALLSVTIVGSSSVYADALSTACFVLGLEEGIRLLSEFPDADGIFITERRKVFITEGLADIFTLTDNRFSLSTVTL